MRARFFFSTAMSIALAGCMSTTEITTEPVDVKMTGAKGVQVQRTEIVPARTVLYDSAGKRKEVTGVPCTAKNERFTASYSTPANVRIPVFGAKSLDLSVMCTYQGQRVATVIGVRNLTHESMINAGAAGGGLLGMAIASGMAKNRGNRAEDQYGYHPLTVALNKKQ